MIDFDIDKVDVDEKPIYVKDYETLSTEGFYIKTNSTGTMTFNFPTASQYLSTADFLTFTHYTDQGYINIST